ncbi:hypothetical protein BK816_08550 [Boudabousia tangfeifanii]|uniref:Metal ABC transporter permease n=1 Tax=Boudabousia tangfeifanii TaxID=1912795 RepID=A0A1D9MME9_9ACTO|nr:metal ABC transporter permease [Boudabousia tangfeifanii]AOZ73320.1 hypothetical protein BK816_08550 [Boudabousia tangfeifanii]
MSSMFLLPSVEIVLVSALCGLVGVLALLRQRIFFTQALTHATFPGAVAGVVLLGLFVPELSGSHPWLSAAIFLGATVGCLLLAGALQLGLRLPGQSSQAVAGVLLTAAFALGYFLAKWFAPLPVRISSFLTGNLLNVNRADLALTTICLALAIGVALTRGRHLIALCFDEVGWMARGGNRTWLDALLSILIIAVVVVSLPAVGSILAIGLIAGPAAGLARVIPSAPWLLVLAPIWAAFWGLAGLWVSVATNLATGGTIALAAALGYLLPALAGRVLGKENDGSRKATVIP